MKIMFTKLSAKTAVIIIDLILMLNTQSKYLEKQFSVYVLAE